MTRGQASKKSKVKGKGQKFNQVMKKLLFSRGRPWWLKFLLQIFISMICRTCFVKKPQTGTIFGSKIQVVKLSRLACFLVNCPLRLLYCLQVQESSIFPHPNQKAASKIGFQNGKVILQESGHPCRVQVGVGINYRSESNYVYNQWYVFIWFE